MPQPLVGLDLREHLLTVLTGQVQVEEDEVGHGHVGMLLRPPQEGHRLLAIPGDVQVVAELAVASPSRVRSTSPGLSSTCKISMGLPSSVPVVIRRSHGEHVAHDSSTLIQEGCGQ